VTFRDGDVPRFAAIVPARAFRAGPAGVELIALTAAGPRLLRGSTASYTLADGGTSILDGSGQRFPIASGSAGGQLDALTVEPAAVKAAGWAGTTQPPAPAQRVVIFAGDRFVGSVRPELPRPDLEQKFGERLARAGFELSGWATGPRPGSAAAPLRAFAIVAGKAYELPKPKPASFSAR
jgi:hypothetical protein